MSREGHTTWGKKTLTSKKALTEHIVLCLVRADRALELRLPKKCVRGRDDRNGDDLPSKTSGSIRQKRERLRIALELELGDRRRWDKIGNIPEDECLPSELK